MRVLLGLDDTDSRFGHCTTHQGYLIACELERLGFNLPVYPRLVRLNPNIPFKTRGNAAVCIEFEAGSERKLDEAFAAAVRLLESEADVKNGANSAMVMVSADSREELAFFRKLYLRAVSGVVNYRGVLAEMSKMEVRHKLLGNGMGIVGAAASLGFFCDEDDHTYELITYRRPETCGTMRTVDPKSVVEMEASTFPHTFNDYDHESERMLIAPTGPDPVLTGLRGDSPEVVLKASRMVRLGEVPLGHIIFASNQCTDAHLRAELQIPLRVFSSGWLEGVVSETHISEGAHLALQLSVQSSNANCMVYEPAGDLRRVARLLRPGDRVRVFGGVRSASSRNPAVVNVERVDLLKLAGTTTRANPLCKVCGSRMKSEGTAKGFQCERCGHKSLQGKVGKLVPRSVQPGIYLPSPRAQRHLTKQLIRYGREQQGVRPLIDGWIESQSQESLRVSSRLSASSARMSMKAA